MSVPCPVSNRTTVSTKVSNTKSDTIHKEAIVHVRGAKLEYNNWIKTLFFHSFHSQRKIHESYLCMPQILHTQVCRRYLRMPQIYSFDWGILSMPWISVANTSMPQIFVAYTGMTRVSSFENGRNEKIMSYKTSETKAVCCLCSKPSLSKCGYRI